MFRHHPDGWIYINEVQFPLAFFQSMEPEYALPEGMIGRIYVPHQSHKVYSHHTEFPLGMSWAEGDEYIAQLPRYTLAYQRLLNRQQVDTNPLKKKVRPLWQ